MSYTFLYYIKEYQKLLEKAGVKTELLLVKGVLHGFLSLPGNTTNNFIKEMLVFNPLILGVFPQATAESIDAVRDFMASI